MAELDRAKRYGKIADILRSLVSAADEWGLETALSKSGIPILKTLGAFNEWWAQRRARKEVPDEVAEELGRIYGFDGSDTTERGVIEERLESAGVRDGDVAYELGLRRLTARIKHADLVDYLQQEFAGWELLGSGSEPARSWLRGCALLAYVP